MDPFIDSIKRIDSEVVTSFSLVVLQVLPKTPSNNITILAYRDPNPPLVVVGLVAIPGTDGTRSVGVVGVKVP